MSEINIVLEKVYAKFPQYREEKFNFAERIQNMAPAILKSLEMFLDDGQSADITLFGYSFEKLTENDSMNPIAAHLTLDWIIREPDEAIASLKRGHDTVKF